MTVNDTSPGHQPASPSGGLSQDIDRILDSLLLRSPLPSELAGYDTAAELVLCAANTVGVIVDTRTFDLRGSDRRRGFQTGLTHSPSPFYIRHKLSLLRAWVNGRLQQPKPFRSVQSSPFDTQTGFGHPLPAQRQSLHAGIPLRPEPRKPQR